MIAEAVHVVMLASKLVHLGVPPTRALEHAAAAELAADERLPAELLLGVAWVESRFDPTATSRVIGDRRVTGAWPSRSQAGKGPWFCGPMQTIAGRSWARCLAQRELAAGYRAGAGELRRWLRLARGDLAAALRGHGCGTAGMIGTCRRYDQRVLAMARRIGWARDLDRTRPRAPRADVGRAAHGRALALRGEAPHRPGEVARADGRVRGVRRAASARRAPDRSRARPALARRGRLAVGARGAVLARARRRCGDARSVPPVQRPPGRRDPVRARATRTSATRRASRNP